MNNMIDLRAFRDSRITPVLVLLDIHVGQAEAPGAADVLEKCRALLARARDEGWLIGFVRPVRFSEDGRAWTPRWLEGFAPRRADMVFDRRRPSCYASADFADAITGAGGAFALAGFFGNTAGLSTLSDAFHNGHRVTFLFDACASETLPGFAPADSQRALAAMAGGYGDSATAEKWIEATGKFQQEKKERGPVSAMR
jgi:nicotinamidase-related amidase